jgi:hypothetical protein
VLEAVLFDGGHTLMRREWADDAPDAPEPDYRAFTPLDVLNVVRRLAPAA